MSRGVLATIGQVMGALRAKMLVADHGATLVRGASIDTRTLERGDLFFALEGEQADGHQYLEQAYRAGAAGAVISRLAAAPTELLPRFPLLIVDDVTKALQDTAVWYRRRLAAHVVAVTGSCGKSTTKEILRAVLSTAGATAASPKSFNNHLGVPLSILGAPPSTEYLVLEMGTSAPGEIASLTRLAWPEVAAITNIGPAHLERLGSLDGVARAKSEIFEGLIAGGLAVTSALDPHSRLIAQSLRARGGCRVRTFGPGGDLGLRRLADAERPTHLVSLHEDTIPALDEGLELVADDGSTWWLPGRNRAAASSALAAIIIARELGLSDEQISLGLASFQPLPMRQQLHRLAGEVLLIDDAYNANPMSMEAALEQLEIDGAGRRRVAVLGEMRELGTQRDHWHAVVGRRAARSADLVWSVGVRDLASGASTMADAARSADAAARAWQRATEVAEEIVCEVKDGDVVLVKGSRAVGLERVVRALIDVRAPLGGAA